VSINKYAESPIARAYNENSLTNYGGVLEFRLFALITSISISSFYIEYLYFGKTIFTSYYHWKTPSESGKNTFSNKTSQKVTTSWNYMNLRI
jgi:hypothetical protein